MLAALGGPAGEVAPRTPQSVVAHVTWAGGSSDPGTYAFLLLDGRLAPQRPLRGYGGWWPGDPEGTGPHWDGRYAALGEHYPWLARAGSSDTDALGVPAAEGEATLAYYFDRSRLPTARPARDLVLAMAFVDADGEVRWARKVPLTEG